MEIFFAIPEVCIIGSIGMQKQVYFMALKTECILFFIVVVKKTGGIWPGEEVLEKRAVGGVARCAFLLGNVAMQLGISFVDHGLMAIVANKAVVFLGQQVVGCTVEGMACQTIASSDGGVQVVIIDNDLVTFQADLLAQRKNLCPGLGVIPCLVSGLMAVGAIAMALGQRRLFCH